VVVRALDPRLRSALVVEDGVRRVVINSRYPLFEVRRGDLWYQLETALREVCVTIRDTAMPDSMRRGQRLGRACGTIQPAYDSCILQVGPSRRTTRT
jgi:hypothetical protein